MSPIWGNNGTFSAETEFDPTTGFTLNNDIPSNTADAFSLSKAPIIFDEPEGHLQNNEVIN